MLAWKHQGYVPDSEDEDLEADSLSINSSTPPEQINQGFVDLDDVHGSERTDAVDVNNGIQRRLEGGERPSIRGSSRPPEQIDTRDGIKHIRDGLSSSNPRGLTDNVDELCLPVVLPYNTGNVCVGLEERSDHGHREASPSSDLFETRIEYGVKEQNINGMLSSSSLMSRRSGGLAHGQSPPSSETSPMSSLSDIDTIREDVSPDVEPRAWATIQASMRTARLPTPKFESVQPVRSLRQRNPIQLHPYAVELQQHRKAMQSRGLKALRVQEPDVDSQQAESNTQHQSFVFAEETQSFGGSSPLAYGELSGMESVGRQKTHPVDEVLDNVNEELPDIESLLQSTTAYIRQGHKRRRTAPSSKYEGVPQRVKHGSTAANARPKGTSVDLFDVPPSLPTSNAAPILHVAGDSNGFRPPPGVNLLQRQTPCDSSELRRRPEGGYLDSLGSDEQLYGEEKTEIEGWETRRSPSESDHGHEIQLVQRKTRGVLPASWSRLDLQKQKNKPENRKSTGRYRIHFPMKNELKRGVARPIPSNRRHQFATDEVETAWLDPDSSDGDSHHSCSLSQAPLVSRNDQNRMTIDLGWLDSDESMEDNTIDPMLPSKARNRIPKGHQRSLFQRRTELRTRQEKISNHFAKTRPIHQRAKGIKATKFGIVDSVISPGAGAPDFLRIAARTAKSRLDLGRHSPVRKSFKLQTDQDTAHVQQILREWREGSLRPSSNRTPYRGPFLPVSGNERGRSNIAGNNSGSTVSPATSDRVPSPHTIPRRIRYRQKTIAQALKQCKITKAPGTENPASRPENRVRRSHFLPAAPPYYLQTPAVLEAAYSRLAPLHSLQFSKLRCLDPVETQKHAVPIRNSRGTPIPSHDADYEPRVGEGAPTQSPKKVPKNKATRKRPPRRVQLGNRLWDQPAPNPALGEHDSLTTSVEPFDEPSSLRGLGPYGTQYSINFDLGPLPTGPYFPLHSFIGSGEFSRSLKLSGTRDLDEPPADLDLALFGTFWGPWNDDVSSQLGLRVQRIIDALLVKRHIGAKENGSSEEEAPRAIELLLRYVNRNLSFLDPIDRVSFLQRGMTLVRSILSRLEQVDPPGGNDPSQEPVPVQVSSRVAVFLHQLRQVANKDIVATSIRAEIEVLLRTVVCRTLNLVFLDGFQDVLQYALDNAHLSLPLIRDKHPHAKVEALFIIMHIHENGRSNEDNIWGLLDAVGIFTGMSNLKHVNDFERRWLHMFAILPVLDIDDHGRVGIIRRRDTDCSNWTMVKEMVMPVLEAYKDPHTARMPSFIPYVRTLLGRCLYLIQTWSWQRSEVIIGPLFDFFARHGLHHLRNEEGHGSPKFLSQLSDGMVLIMRPEDRSFHILLKIIGTGLRDMRRANNNKKIRDLVWRLIPNHDRRHPKDQEVRQEDLDALRNHHDLLSTLYWASPYGLRPKVSLFQNLVQVETSHREACHINIRTWSNLVQYQLSTDDPHEALPPFVSWYNELLQQLVRQHVSARVEVESQAPSVENAEGQLMVRGFQESVIARNQGQVEAMLDDALESLRKAINSAKDCQTAHDLIPPSLCQVFGLFDTKQPRTNGVVIKALEIVSALIRKNSSRESSEDSQGLDWSGFEEYERSQSERRPIMHDSIYKSVRALLSNCFGADAPPEDGLLEKVVQTWICVCQYSVKDGNKTWNDFLGPYGNASWTVLGDTEQTRKFSNLYFSRLLTDNHGVYAEYKLVIFRNWVVSLVERDSQLKFQDRLTMVILDLDAENPLLDNPPFCTDPQSGRYRISLQELRDRRLSLIACILSNMRESISFSNAHKLPHRTAQKQEYVDIIKHLMTTMKTRYQEVVSSSAVRGAYVEFVHKVVEFLQQHTQDICPIDPFFTDSADFPLPATDPTYVVGKLKAYGLRLHDPRTPKQLITFVQTVSERAAMDGQQDYLVGQLRETMGPCLGSRLSSSLRTFVLQAIVPAYIQQAFGTDCGWILASPLLQSLQAVFDKILGDFDGSLESSQRTLQPSIETVLKALQQSMGLQVDGPALGQPKTLRLLTVSYAIVVATMPALDYLARLNYAQHDSWDVIDYFGRLGRFARSILRGEEDVDQPMDDDQSWVIPEGDAYVDARGFAARGIREALERWKADAGQWWVAKGSTWKALRVDLGSFDEEKLNFLTQLRLFDDAAGMYRPLEAGGKSGGSGELEESILGFTLA